MGSEVDFTFGKMNRTILLLLVVLASAIEGTATTKLWRDDLRCGEGWKLDDGVTSAQCNPKDHSCCSPHGWCGKSDAYCQCSGCKDYSPVLSPATLIAVLLCSVLGLTAITLCILKTRNPE